MTRIYGIILILVKFIQTTTPIQVCDIGASPIDKTEFIEILLDKTNSNIIGFEPNKDEFIKLEQSSKKKFFNYAIGDGKVHNLNICRASGMTSILKPNYEYLKLFHKFDEWSKILKVIPIQTKKLDEINFDNSLDLIKIDVQGYESEVIKFGNDKIKNSLVIQTETSPIPLYENAKPFSYVCNQLENLGFNLHMFNRIHNRSFKPMIFDNNIYSGLYHLFQLDCVFVKNFKEIDELDEENLKKLILIMFYSFKSYDFVDLLVSKLEIKTKKNYLNQYRDLVKTHKIYKLY